jgi:cyclic lactone autoinducer peptide
MKKLKMLSLKAISNAALNFAKGSVCETSCGFLHQPKMNQTLKNKIKEK